MVDPPGAFGELLRSHRTRVGLTQQQLAERSGVSIRALRYIERGAVGMPRADSLRRLAAALGVTPEALADGAARPAKPVRPQALGLGLLGSFTVAQGGREVPVGALKQRCLLALLALHPNQPVSRAEIIDVLWGDDPPDSCQGLIHTYASRLRKLLTEASKRNAEVLRATQAGYRLAVKPDQLDSLRFEDLARQAKLVRAVDADTAADLFDEALALWRGPVLADLPAGLRGHPAAVALAARRREVATAHADVALALGRYDRVVAVIRHLAHEEPLHEGLHARLMLGLAGGGEQAEALRVFADIRARLDDELGVEPGLEIQDAHLRVLRDRPAPPPPLPEPVAQRPPAQLPAETPGFVGRAATLAGLDDLLDRVDGSPGVVIVALSGTAGVGKTALALRWAHRARDRFPDGQLAVNLHGYAPGMPLTTQEVLVRFLHALGVAPERVPLDPDEAAGLYRTLLTGKRVLVMLDNAAAAEQVRPLLPGSSGCLVLVTSRDRLTGLTAQDGAHQIPLDVLDPGEAIDLLGRLVGVGRMRREPDAAAEMASICGHLPLALRIAGANLAIRPLVSIADYTRELRERGRMTGLTVAGDESGAVRAAFDLSYEKLVPAARRLFRLLGLVPGADVDAAAAGTLSGLPPGDVTRLLRVLDHGNLIREHSRGRYTFHDLLREYASGRSALEDAETERTEAVVALFDHYLSEIETHSSVLWRVGALPEHGAEERAIAWLDAERGNLVAAATAASGLDLHRYAWRFAEALRQYFWNRGHGADGLVVGQAALAAARATRDLDAEASVHDLLGLIHTNLSDYVAAIESHRWALELSQSTGNRIVEAAALHNLGRAHSQLGQPAQASAFYEQALELNRVIGNRFGEAGALNYLGGTALSLGRPQQAIDRHTEALELSTRIGNRHVQAAACQGLGLALWAMGELPRAAQRYREGMAICRRYGYRHGEVSMLICLAETGCDAGDYAASATQVRKAMEAGRQLGERRHEVSGLDILATIQQRTGEWSSAATHYTRALGLAREIRFGYGEASVLTGLCALYRRTGDPRSAIDYGTSALALMRDTGMRLLEARALTELAHAHLDGGDPASAAEHIEEGLTIAIRTGQRLAEARARHVRALVRQLTGNRPGAVTDWQTALPLFERLGVPEAAHVRALLAAFTAG
ncbi:tetratricopeptide repeat protein [Actinokineospora auranticolor]|uniref:DNA-binding SARP family transcriptional activator n=1 Tax=Actinokineospora auranticolor TaxID=155976 RepID=A0A2S6GUT1_9PSEU|nr:tetratricopeptide repeat protein [Actinokineospora auranticolor]PPK68953.1 DNA-binding SARP family transcriptional activator [Actinokineospora auranticolor]